MASGHGLTTGTYNWEDALRLDDALTEEERMVQHTAREYAQDKLMPRITMANRYCIRLRHHHRVFDGWVG